MTFLKAVLILLVVGGLAWFILGKRRAKQAPERLPAADTSIRTEPPATKTPPNIPTNTQAPPQEPASEDLASEDLSQSGTVFVEGEIERCIESERWDEAVKWLTHALGSLPQRDDMKVTLAEVYARKGDTEAFTQHFERLFVDLPENHPEHNRLLEIAREAIPDHAVFDVNRQP